MNYPLISEYIEAIKAAEDNFEQLSYLRPVLDDDGLPVMTSGNFAVVFKMKDERDEKFFAVKCFTKEQEGREEAYHQITEELKNVSSPYLTSVRYLDKELFVDTDQTNETEFPVLLMDWVEGKTLDKYLRENLDDKFALEMLAYRFSQLAQWLIPQPFAHGDLKPDNILVRDDGTLILVDYDGMYVPAMKGQKARELGSPDFRHPQRTENDFDEHIDDFAIASILLSLEALYINKHLFDKYSNDGRLLFSAKDYQNLGESTVLKGIFPSSVNSINNLAALLVLLCNCQHLYIQHPELLNMDYLSTNPAEYDERLRDNDGAMYSDDGKRILGFGSYSNLDIYKIKEGTIVICDLAFNNYENDNHFLRGVNIPASVSIIGINPFAGCIGLSICCDTELFKLERSILYSNDYSRLISSTNSTTEALDLNPNTKIIGAYALSYCRAKRINLPRHLQVIEEYAFSCSDVELLIIPESVKSISRGAFSYCKSLKNVIIKGETSIEPSIFDECTNLKHIFITPSKIECYKKILSNVANLIYDVGTWEYFLFEEVNFAKDIFELGKKYWEGKDIEKDLNEAIELYGLASELGDKDAKKESEKWGKYWFDEDKAIYSKDRKIFHGVLSGVSVYEIKEGTKFIADSACSDMGWEIDCSFFCKLTIPSSIIGIGDNPFGSQMSEVICLSPYFELENNTLYSKGKKELIQCYNHETDVFDIPEGVEIIRSYAFYACTLRKVIIPSSVSTIGENPFIETGVWEKHHNRLEILSNSTSYEIFNDALFERNKLIAYWGEKDLFELPKGIEEIGNKAFWGATLTNLKLPTSLKTVAEDSFYWTVRLKEIVIPANEMERFKQMLPPYIHNIIIEDK